MDVDRLAKLVEQLDVKIVDLRNATSEANMALKDLRGAVKEARELRAELRTAAEQDVNEQMKPVVEKGLEDFGRELKKAIDLGTEAVYKRFDTITDVLMGEDKQSARQGKKSLPDLAEEAARRTHGKNATS